MRTTAGINKADRRDEERANRLHRCVAAGISDDGGQLSRFMVRFVRRQQRTGRTNCRLSWGTPPRKVKADTWSSRKASVVSAGYAFTKQPSLWGRSMTKQWVFCSTPPMATRDSPKSHWAWPGAMGQRHEHLRGHPKLYPEAENHPISVNLTRSRNPRTVR